MMEPHLFTKDDIGNINDIDLLIVEITGDPAVSGRQIYVIISFD